jgi:hypothetical protein
MMNRKTFTKRGCVIIIILIVIAFVIALASPNPLQIRADQTRTAESALTQMP